MPYSKSRARVEFETTSYRLLSLAREISYKKVRLTYDHKNMVYQSSIVLLSSTLEEYFRNLIEGIFFNYRNRTATLSELPLNSRTFSYFRRQKTIFEAFITNKDEGKILERLNLGNSFYDMLNPSLPYTHHVDSKLIVNDKKYPKPDNVRIIILPIFWTGR